MSWSEKAETLHSYLNPSRTRALPPKLGDCRPTRWGFVCKMSLKAPFRSYTLSKSTDDRNWPICCSLLDAESTGFGRIGCDAAFLLYSQSNMVEQSGHVLLGAQINCSPRQQATTFTLRFNSSDRTAPKKRSNRLVSCTCRHGDQVTGVRRARDHLFNHVRLGK